MDAGTGPYRHRKRMIVATATAVLLSTLAPGPVLADDLPALRQGSKERLVAKRVGDCTKQVRGRMAARDHRVLRIDTRWDRRMYATHPRGLSPPSGCALPGAHREKAGPCWTLPLMSTPDSLPRIFSASSIRTRAAEVTGEDPGPLWGCPLIDIYVVKEGIDESYRPRLSRTIGEEALRLYALAVAVLQTRGRSV
jgi:hypothetical protein